MKTNGPYETFHENGRLKAKSNYNMGEQCGEWVENGETVTYDPWPPDLEESVIN
jgi:antitoxin component YwqK of YwqJK toxin-antitoxin module